MGEFAFGENFHCLVGPLLSTCPETRLTLLQDSGGQYHYFVKTVFNGSVMALQMMQLESYGIMTMLKPFLPKSAMRPKEAMDEYTKELVDRRMDRGWNDPETVDVFSYM